MSRGGRALKQLEERGGVLGIIALILPPSRDQNRGGGRRLAGDGLADGLRLGAALEKGMRRMEARGADLPDLIWAVVPCGGVAMVAGGGWP